MIPRLRFIAFVCLLIVIGIAGRASAQSVPSAPDASDAAAPDEGRFRFGPLRFTPSIALSNIGLDSNVFNDPANPKQDTTAALGPAVNLWMNLGHSKLSGKASGQYLYFNTYDNQRSWNTADELRWEWPFARIKPFVSGAYTNTKQRPGYEIDSRAHLRTDQVSVGTSVDFSSKTSVVLTASRAHLLFDQGQLFLGTDLAAALNRTTDTEEVQLRYRLTSLTTLVVNADALQDHFTFDPLRDSRSIKVLPGFEFKPSALISGMVFVGFRSFTASDPRLPDYQGVIASVDAKYTVSASRLGVKVSRDLVYSYDPEQPYYTLTDLQGTLTERVTRKLELVGRGGVQLLGYQALRTLPATDSHTDIITQYGGGIGYLFGRTTRVGFDAMYYQRRTTDTTLPAFDGLRFGASFSYGLPQ
jgi:hypothetical protein